MTRKVLVTGGAGFIGSHLVELLLSRGDDVTVVDDASTGSFANLKDVQNTPHLTVIDGDCADVSILDDILGQVDQVYHLAAAVGVALIAKEPIQSIERNIQPTQLILDRLTQRMEAGDPAQFFMASSSEVYGKNPKPIWKEDDDLVFGPTTRARWSYGASKAIDEFLTLACWRQSKLPVAVARFFNVVGPRQTGAYGMVLPRFVEAALANKPLVVHDDGQQTRCFAHVKDVAAAVVRLLDTPSAAGQVYNLGSDQPISILDLAQQVIQRLNSRSEIQFQSYADAYDSDFEDVRHRVPDLSRIKGTIGFQAENSLIDIIDDVAAYQKQHES